MRKNGRARDQSSCISHGKNSEACSKCLFSIYFFCKWIIFGENIEEQEAFHLFSVISTFMSRLNCNVFNFTQFISCKHTYSTGEQWGRRGTNLCVSDDYCLCCFVCLLEFFAKRHCIVLMQCIWNLNRKLHLAYILKNCNVSNGFLLVPKESAILLNCRNNRLTAQRRFLPVHCDAGV